MSHRLLLLIVGFCSLSLPACSSSPPVGEEMVHVAIDKSNTEELLHFFFGSYLGEDGGDPFEAGLLTEQNGDFYINVDSLRSVFPPATERMMDQNGDDTVVWEELKEFVQSTYYEARDIPLRIEMLRDELAYRDSSSWFRVDVDGVMTNARRRIYVARGAITAALEGYRSADERLIYPVGTTIVGEHWMGGEMVEATAMRKREDGYWDYFVYDSTGQRTASTHTEPKQLDVPTQCAGCHFGSRLFEPEESFPARPRPGPHGPRRIHVEDDLRRADVVTFFSEHRKRSDDVLGLYGTLFVSRLLALENTGRLTPEEAALLNVINL